jgi:short subunit dehydrogenase-like uncharacterized protein
MSKAFSILVLGATGFTGRLIALYLAKAAPPGVSLGIGGRNKQQLTRVKQDMLREDGERQIGIVEVDINNPESLDQALRQTQVLVNTVGPFLNFSLPIVEACVRNGVDYCDITGEPVFVRRTIDQFDEEARRKGLLIISCAGFDSIPSDLGVLMVVDEMKKRWDEQAATIENIISFKSYASGGTLRSIREAIHGDATSGPHYLYPAGERQTPQSAFAMLFSLLPTYSHGAKSWTCKRQIHSHNRTDLLQAPFLMEAVNCAIVHRSNALSQFSFAASNFHYCERIKERNFFRMSRTTYAIRYH